MCVYAQAFVCVCLWLFLTRESAQCHGWKLDASPRSPETLPLSSVAQMTGRPLNLTNPPPQIWRWIEGGEKQWIFRVWISGLCICAEQTKQASMRLSLHIPELLNYFLCNFSHVNNNDDDDAQTPGTTYKSRCDSGGVLNGCEPEWEENTKGGQDWDELRAVREISTQFSGEIKE